LDLAAQAPHVEFCVQKRNAPLLSFEGERCETGIEFPHLSGAEAKRQRAGDDRAGRRAADQIEMIAEPDVLAEVLGEDLLHALQKCDRDRPAHAAAVERQHALWSGTKKLVITGAGIFRNRVGLVGRLVHLSPSNWRRRCRGQNDAARAEDATGGALSPEKYGDV